MATGGKQGERWCKRRRRRRGLFSKETLAGELMGSIPRLALLPQQASCRLGWRTRQSVHFDRVQCYQVFPSDSIELQLVSVYDYTVPP